MFRSFFEFVGLTGKDADNVGEFLQKFGGHSFLNGKDGIENLEVSDMEIYWEIMAPLINL